MFEEKFATATRRSKFHIFKPASFISCTEPIGSGYTSGVAELNSFSLQLWMEGLALFQPYNLRGGGGGLFVADHNSKTALFSSSKLGDF